jgi:hypothetical protein
MKKHNKQFTSFEQRCDKNQECKWKRIKTSHTYIYIKFLWNLDQPPYTY